MQNYMEKISYETMPSWQDKEQIPCTEFLRMKSLDITTSKQLQVVSWFHTNDGSVHLQDPRFTCLSDTIILSIENMTHQKSRSHSESLVCE